MAIASKFRQGPVLASGCLARSQQPDRQSKHLLQQAATQDWQEHMGDTIGSSIADAKPGYKWDQFLTIPEVPSRPHTLMSAVLARLLPSWIMHPPHTSDQLTQPSSNDDTVPIELNNATWVPILPAPIAWMMHNAEDRIEKAGVKLSKAQLLAKLTSVSYCQRNNIKAWNCSR